jgi:hypothetical protein
MILKKILEKLYPSKNREPNFQLSNQPDCININAEGLNKVLESLRKIIKCWKKQKMNRFSKDNFNKQLHLTDVNKINR